MFMCFDTRDGKHCVRAIYSMFESESDEVETMQPKRLQQSVSVW